jgi:ABC-type transport system involved in multi-copper enzyme maturation permease subunit
MTFLAMFKKESLLLLRSRRAVVLLYAYLTALALVVLWSWPTNNVLTMAALTSQRLVYLIGVGQTLMLLAILPGLTANSIVRERETGCLELLQASRLSPVVILLGKALGCATYAGLLLVCSLPLIALGHILGTLDLRLLGLIYLHLVITSLWAGMIGIGVSAVARSGYGALMGSYAVVLALSAVTVFPSFLFAGHWPAVLRSASPLGSMVTLIEPGIWVLFTGSTETGPVVQWYGACCFVGICFFGMIAWLQLSRPFHVRGHSNSRLIDARSEVIRRKLRFPFYLIDPQRRRRPIGNWINPVFARELRSRMLGQGTNFIRVFYAVLIFSFIVTIYAVFRTEAEIVDSFRVLVIASQVVLIGLLTPPLASPAVSRERELNTLDLLRLTYVGPWRLVAGKWYFAMLVSLCILVAAIPMWAALFGLQRIPPEMLARAIYVVLAAVVCGTTSALLASSLVRRTGTATGLAYVLAMGILFGTLLPIVISSTLSLGMQVRLLSLNPIVAAVHSVSLELFRNLLDANTWRTALVFLLSLSAAQFAIAVLVTRRLYRSR